MMRGANDDRPKQGVFSRRAGRAMTLIELLVVMAVMAVIVSAIVVAAFSASRKGQRTGTEGLMKALAQGLDQYKNTYRMYVPQLPQPTLTTERDYSIPEQAQEVTLPLWTALELESDRVDILDTFKGEGGKVTQGSTGVAVTWYYYRDALEIPLRYVCEEPYQRYTLTGAGEDGEFDTGDEIVHIGQ